MQLYYSNTSPFARKVLIALIEKGLDAQVEIVALSPVGEGAELIQSQNPLGKIPVLIDINKNAIFDSPVICEYIDTLSPLPQLLPATGKPRFDALKMQALCDGIMDAAFSIVMEKRRENGAQSQFWLERWHQVIYRSLNAIEESRIDAEHNFDIGQIALASAIGYVEFRLPEIKIPSELQYFWSIIKTRKSVSLTAPPSQ